MKKMSAKITALATVFMCMPLLALAQDGDGPSENFGEIGNFAASITTFINGVLIPLTFAIALLLFLFGVVKYFIWGGSDPTSREEGTKLMLYSVAGFVLMVSIFGIVNLIAGGLGLDTETIDTIPDAPAGQN